MLYGGATMDCALMKTVFHDAPYAAGFKTFDKGKPVGQAHSTAEVAQPLAKTAANGPALAGRRDGLRAWRRLFCCDAILWLRASAGSAGKGMGTAGCPVFRVETGAVRHLGSYQSLLSLWKFKLNRALMWGKVCEKC